MIKLTIVTVTKNDCKNFQKTLLSIKKIKSDSIQYIVVDGNSIDKTLSVLERNKDIVDDYISEKDCGIYDAMNKGLDMASGRYVMFLNAGDELKDINRILSDIECIDLKKSPTLLYGSEFSWSMSLTKVILPKFNFCKMPTSHQAMIFNTNKAQLYHYNTKYIFSADYDLYLRIEKNTMDEALAFKRVVVRTAPVGFTSTSISRYLKECLRINLEYNNNSGAYIRYFIDIVLHLIKRITHLLLSDSIILRIRKLRGGKS